MRNGLPGARTSAPSSVRRAHGSAPGGRRKTPRRSCRYHAPAGLCSKARSAGSSSRPGDGDSGSSLPTGQRSVHRGVRSARKSSFHLGENGRTWISTTVRSARTISCGEGPHLSDSTKQAGGQTGQKVCAQPNSKATRASGKQRRQRTRLDSYIPPRFSPKSIF